MPGLDRSGPMRAGPMTGGRRGICGLAGAAANRPAYGSGYYYGRGMGFRRGYGRGRVYGIGNPVSKIDELEMLRADADAMQKSLEAVLQRIVELEKEGTE